MENKDILAEIRKEATLFDNTPVGDTLSKAVDEIERLNNEVINLTARLWNCQHEHPVDAIARRSDIAY